MGKRNLDFSRAGPHLPGGGPAPGAAASADPVVGSQVWEKPSWMDRCLLLPKARGCQRVLQRCRGRPPAPPRSQRCAASPRGRRPGGAPAGAPRTAAVWSVLNSGWKRLVTGRLNLPRPATLPSSSSSFRVFSSKLPRGRGWGAGGGPQTKQTNEACGAVFGARRRALCGSLSDQRRAGDATGFRAVGFDRHLPSASPGRGAGGPEADELREPGANSGSAARCRRGRVPGSQQIGETREPNGEVSSLFRVAPTRPAL